MGFCWKKFDHDYYKYKLTEDYVFPRKLTELLPIGGTGGKVEHIELDTDGTLTIKKGYAWDGASWLASDYHFMPGSCVHDALYQLMRMRYLNYKTQRHHADAIMRKINRGDGMSWFRAWYTWWVVRRGGESSAQPRDGKS